MVTNPGKINKTNEGKPGHLGLVHLRLTYFLLSLQRLFPEHLLETYKLVEVQAYQ
jgi:hypothetical protein